VRWPSRCAKVFEFEIIKAALMSKMGDHFRRGKLQVARSIVEELYCVYSGSAFAIEFRTAWYALNRADTALIAKVQKPSRNSKSTKPRKRKMQS